MAHSGNPGSVLGVSRSAPLCTSRLIEFGELQEAIVNSDSVGVYCVAADIQPDMFLESLILAKTVIQAM